MRVTTEQAGRPAAPTIQEIQTLPTRTWHDLSQILFNESPSNPLSSTMLGWFRRAPISKSETDLSPGAKRPIDVFSVILRAVTSRQANLLKPGFLQVVIGNNTPPLEALKRQHLD